MIAVELGLRCSEVHLFSVPILLGASSTVRKLSIDDVEGAAIASVAAKNAWLVHRHTPDAFGDSDAWVNDGAGRYGCRWARDSASHQGEGCNDGGGSHVDFAL